MNSGICDSIQTEHNIYHIITVKSTASSTLILLRTHRQIADNHCRNRHLMQPLTSQPASTSVISINACRVNHYPPALGFGHVQGKPANKRMGIRRGFIANVAIRADFTTDNTIDEYWEMAAPPLDLGSMLVPNGID
jgi:hypothetical protein